jgi:general secretion pathway protein B
VAAAASATEERVYAMNELPDDIRRQLPGLSVGGSMYSTTPASRLVIVNGQVLHEGDRLTPELVLQQIRLKTAVFAFKGYRFTITF